MTIRSVLKSRIEDDLARYDIPNQIYDAINDAITHYQSTRFYFTETRTVAFLTVAGQSYYSAADDPDIPDMYAVDDAQINGPGNQVYSLDREDATVLEALINSTASSGDPFSWAWADRGMLLYPIPNRITTIRLLGGIKKAAPTDDTPGNVWMTEAFELIRAHAKLLLAVHVTNDDGLAQRMSAAAEGAKARLERETSSKRATSQIMATAF
jgi:hypothetical protein